MPAFLDPAIYEGIDKVMLLSDGNINLPGAARYLLVLSTVFFADFSLFYHFYVCFIVQFMEIVVFLDVYEVAVRNVSQTVSRFHCASVRSVLIWLQVALMRNAEDSASFLPVRYIILSDSDAKV